MEVLQSTVHSSLHFLPTVSSVAEQIEKMWFPTYGAKTSSASWSSDDTLFAVFDSINDVGNSWSKGAADTSVLYPEIMSVYEGVLDELYYDGARKFLFINLPPVNRAPLALIQSTENQAEEKAAISV